MPRKRIAFVVSLLSFGCTDSVSQSDATGGSVPTGTTQADGAALDVETTRDDGDQTTQDATGSSAASDTSDTSGTSDTAASESSETGPPDDLPTRSALHPVVAGGAHACAIVDGMVRCWGYGTSGQLGDGRNESSRSPASVVGLIDVVDLQARDNATCARNESNELHCWGDNEFGEAGDGTTNRASTPVPVQLPEVASFALGLDHGCAVDIESRVHCWGRNEDGQLGPRADPDEPGPQIVDGLEDIVATDAGNRHTCTLNKNAAVSCWGRNSQGQLGDGTTTDRGTPEIVDLPGPVTQISLGRRTSCAQLLSGEVYCFGANNYGEVDPGDPADAVILPRKISGLEGFVAVDLNCGGHFACAKNTAGELRCWGDSRGGQLGVEKDGEPIPTQQLLGLPPVDYFDAGGHHLCFSSGADTFCMGSNNVGQLGTDGGNSTEPVQIILE